MEKSSCTAVFNDVPQHGLLPYWADLAEKLGVDLSQFEDNTEHQNWRAGLDGASNAGQTGAAEAEKPRASRWDEGSTRVLCMRHEQACHLIGRGGVNIKNLTAHTGAQIITINRVHRSDEQWATSWVDVCLAGDEFQIGHAEAFIRELMTRQNCPLPQRAEYQPGNNAVEIPSQILKFFIGPKGRNILELRTKAQEAGALNCGIHICKKHDPDGNAFARVFGDNIDMVLELVRANIQQIKDMVSKPKNAHMLRETGVRDSRKLRLLRRLSQLIKIRYRQESGTNTSGKDDSKVLWRKITHEGELLFTSTKDIPEDELTFWKATWAQTKMPPLTDLELLQARVESRIQPVIEKGKIAKKQIQKRAEERQAAKRALGLAMGRRRCGAKAVLTELNDVDLEAAKQSLAKAILELVDEQGWYWANGASSFLGRDKVHNAIIQQAGGLKQFCENCQELEYCCGTSHGSTTYSDWIQRCTNGSFTNNQFGEGHQTCRFKRSYPTYDSDDSDQTHPTRDKDNSNAANASDRPHQERWTGKTKKLRSHDYDESGCPEPTSKKDGDHPVSASDTPHQERWTGKSENWYAQDYDGSVWDPHTSHKDSRHPVKATDLPHQDRWSGKEKTWEPDTNVLGGNSFSMVSKLLPDNIAHRDDEDPECIADDDEDADQAQLTNDKSNNHPADGKVGYNQERHIGKVKKWNANTGVGYITLDDGGDLACSHAELSVDILIGTKVEFSLVSESDNRSRRGSSLRRICDVTAPGGGPLKTVAGQFDGITRDYDDSDWVRSTSDKNKDILANVSQAPDRERWTGKIKNWQPGRGLGYVISDEGETFCCHRSDVKIYWDRSDVGLSTGTEVEVSLEVRRHKKGRKRVVYARDVTAPGGGPLKLVSDASTRRRSPWRCRYNDSRDVQGKAPTPSRRCRGEYRRPEEVAMSWANHDGISENHDTTGWGHTDSAPLASDSSVPPWRRKQLQKSDSDDDDDHVSSSSEADRHSNRSFRQHSETQGGLAYFRATNAYGRGIYGSPQPSGQVTAMPSRRECLQPSDRMCQQPAQNRTSKLLQSSTRMREQARPEQASLRTSAKRQAAPPRKISQHLVSQGGAIASTVPGLEPSVSTTKMSQRLEPRGGLVASTVSAPEPSKKVVEHF